MARVRTTERMSKRHKWMEKVAHVKATISMIDLIVLVRFGTRL